MGSPLDSGCRYRLLGSRVARRFRPLTAGYSRNNSLHVAGTCRSGAQAARGGSADVAADGRSARGVSSQLMSKAFTKESDEDEDLDLEAGESRPQVEKNYITPGGYRRLREELAALWDVERPKLVETIAWAASNGDRSENADYIYGKRRLREVDRRIRFLSQRIDAAEVVDNAGRDDDRAFFGATVAYRDQGGLERTVIIVGIDEVDPAHGRVSWISPIAKALLKAREGDVVMLRTPAGAEEVEVLEVRYDELG